MNIAVAPARRSNGHGAASDFAASLSSPVEVTGVVKWFDAAKGFGFIVPDNNMPDVLLHIACLQRDGFQTAHEGARVVCEVVQRPKGLQCFRMLSMDESTPVRPRSAPALMASCATVMLVFGPERMVVKQFDQERGFGFFMSPNKPDVFVHMKTLRRRGISSLSEGQAMMVSYGSNEADSQHRFVATDVTPDIKPK